MPRQGGGARRQQDERHDDEPPERGPVDVADCHQGLADLIRGEGGDEQERGDRQACQREP